MLNLSLTQKYLCFLFFISWAFSVEATLPKKDLDHKQQKIAQSLKAIEQTIEKTQNELSQEEKSLKEIDKSIQAALVESKRLTLSQNKTKKKIKRLQAKAKTLQHEKKETIQALSAYAQSMSETDQSWIKSVFSQKTLHDTLVFHALYPYVAKAHTKKVEDLKASLHDIVENQTQLKTLHQEQRTLQKKLQANRDKLEKKKQKQQAAIQQYQATLETNLAKKKSLLKEQLALQSLIDEIESVIARQSKGDFSSMAGQLPWPVSTHSVSISHVTEKKSPNQSTLLVKEGTDVQAVYAGRVVFSEWLKGIGLLIIVDHGQGYMTLYGNNAALYKSTGDWVEAGETLATVGQSGGQTQAGLYFEIRKDGRPLDLRKWIQHA